jgi:hypothetical protein
MPSLDVIFAWIIAVLAGAACIGALTVVLVAEWNTIHRTIHRHRRPGSTLTDPSGRWWRERSAVSVPEQEQDTVRQAAGRVRAGDSLRWIAKEHRP